MTRLYRGPVLVVVVGVLAALAVPADAGAPPSQYELTADTVHDTKTGLTWQRAVAPGTYAWVDAKSYCAGLDADGGSGWRLPTIKELQTIVDERAYQPAIDTTAFPGTPSEFFWSSSPYANDATNAWVVHFNFGNSSYFTVSYNYRVRCVR